MEIKEERIVEEIQKHKNIPLILNSYDDIFSDFDPRPYTERALSDDFLIECQRAARDKEVYGVELILSMPKLKRSFADEFKIKKRLKDHFKKHFLEKNKEVKGIKKQGLVWILIGSVLLFANTFIKTYSPSFFLNMIGLLMEPASWFSFWEGLAKIFIHSKEKIPDYDFYKKMADVQINFKGY